FAVWREFRPCLPGCLFVVNLARVGSRLSLHPPKSARAVYMSTIGDKHDVIAVRRPCGADLMVEGAVVITRQRTFVLASQPLDIRQIAVCELPDEDMETSVERSRDKCNALAIRRESRLDIYRSAVCQLARLAGLQVESPEFDCIVVIFRQGNPSPVGRDIGLIVVPRPRRELLSNRRSDLLSPQRPRHRIYERFRIRHPCDRIRARGQLRKIHFTVVVGVWRRNLFQYRLALLCGKRSDDRNYQQDCGGSSTHPGLPWKTPELYARHPR